MQGDARDMGSIPGLGRFPGGGNGNPLLCSCLENPMDRGAWRATVHGVTKSWTRLSEHASILPDTKEITTKDLLYRTGSYNQHLVTAYNGSKYKKRIIYIYIYMCIYIYIYKTEPLC